MLRMLLPGLVLVLLAAPAWAGPQTMSWDFVPNTTTHGIEASSDSGATWTAVVPTTGPVCTAPRCTATVNAPASGYVLYRYWDADATGRRTRLTAGSWVCESCAPVPMNVGVQ